MNAPTEGEKGNDAGTKAPPPPPDLEETKKAVHDAAKRAAAEGKDWDKTWAALAQQYPADWVDENYAELQDAFADGWQEGTED